MSSERGSRDPRLLEVGTIWERQDGQEVEVVGFVRELEKPPEVYYRIGRTHKHLSQHRFLQKHLFVRDPRFAERAAERSKQPAE